MFRFKETISNLTSKNKKIQNYSSKSFNWHRELKINNETVLYDLSYSKDHNQTPFLKWGSQRSEKYFDGFGMLINQAAASFALWTGEEPETNITKLDLIDD